MRGLSFDEARRDTRGTIPAGIVGKTAGKQPGFGYSPALKRSPMKWNAVNLDRWLADSNAAVPGSVMNYRQADATKRQALVTYLTTGK